MWSVATPQVFSRMGKPIRWRAAPLERSNRMGALMPMSTTSSTPPNLEKYATARPTNAIQPSPIGKCKNPKYLHPSCPLCFGGFSVK